MRILLFATLILFALANTIAGVETIQGRLHHGQGHSVPAPRGNAYGYYNVPVSERSRGNGRSRGGGNKGKSKAEKKGKKEKKSKKEKKQKKQKDKTIDSDDEGSFENEIVAAEAQRRVLITTPVQRTNSAVFIPAPMN